MSSKMHFDWSLMAGAGLQVSVGVPYLPSLFFLSQLF